MIAPLSFAQLPRDAVVAINQVTGKGPVRGCRSTSTSGTATPPTGAS